MYVVLSVVIGLLYAAGIYLLLQRSIVKLIFGLVMISHGANLLIFTVGGLKRAAPPLVKIGEHAPPAGYTDPVPQALILTAIVIGFAVLAFAGVMVRQVYKTLGTDDSDEMQATDS